MKSPTFRPPPRVQPGPRLSSRAEDPAPRRPSLLEPRWRPAESIASRCHSCCLWPLCCYLCCSPAPSPYVSVRAPADLGGLTFISAIWKTLQGSRMESEKLPLKASFLLQRDTTATFSFLKKCFGRLWLLIILHVFNVVLGSAYDL